MKLVSTPLFFAAVLVVSACSSLKVVSDKDPAVDFSQIKTYEYYGWQENSDQILNDLDKRRIEAAFNEEFEARGLTYVEEGGDVIVSLFVVVNTETTTTAYTNHYNAGLGGYGYGRYGWGGGWGMGYGTSTTTYRENDYQVGTLVVDMFDTDKKELIWQSVGSGVVKENPKGREERIQKAVNAIMREYPVKPGRQED